MSTYTPIASITLSSAQSSVTFSSIPQTYTDLILVSVPKVTSPTTFGIRLNSDSGSNYSETIMYGNGTSAASALLSNQTEMRITYGGTARTTNTGMFKINVQNYSNSTTFKMVLSREDWATEGTGAIVGLWRSTAAISSITIIPISGGTIIDSGTTFNLYGIANAGITNVAKATGGDSVYTDGTYWYHTFLSSGVFTPTQSLTADYLVVAGGGGAFSGGGGAGGLRCTVGATGGGGSLESPLSLTAQAYTVTVGAGGTGGAWAGANPTTGSNSVFSSITSTGGGAGGGGVTSPSSLINGGSGGGGFGNPGTPGTSQTGGTGTTNQGYAGGTATKAGSSSPTYYAGAGGGGAGAVGSNSTPHSSPSSALAGNGGVGVQTSISGTATYYAGGGGGGNEGTGNTATGGSGGGGNGGTNAGAGTNGVENTGGGGGGRGSVSGSSANGGSGIVIVRYAV